MADAKVSALTAIDAVAAGDKFGCADASDLTVSKSVTAAQLKTFVTADTYWIRANVDRTLASSTSVQAIFNSPANGRLTLGTGVYRFEMLLIITAMSSTSGNALIDILGGGTATIASWLWRVSGIDNSAAGTILDDDAAYLQTSGTAASAVTAGTGTAMRLHCSGMFNCTTGGTLIPSIDLVTAASAVVQDGSYMMIDCLGATNGVSVGPWD